jgi:hypothetical protein
VIPEAGAHLSETDRRRWELTRLADALAESGVPAALILDDVRDGIDAATRRHERSGR